MSKQLLAKWLSLTAKEREDVLAMLEARIQIGKGYNPTRWETIITGRLLVEEDALEDTGAYVTLSTN